MILETQMPDILHRGKVRDTYGLSGGHLLMVATAFETSPLTRPLNQDTPHRFRSRCKEMPAAVPTLPVSLSTGIDEADVGFVNESCCL